MRTKFQYVTVTETAFAEDDLEPEQPIAVRTRSAIPGKVAVTGPRRRWPTKARPRAGGWHHHSAFEHRQDALVFLDTTAATPGNECVM